MIIKPQITTFCLDGTYLPHDFNNGNPRASLENILHVLTYLRMSFLTVVLVGETCCWKWPLVSEGLLALSLSLSGKSMNSSPSCIHTLSEG
jgi:hypothetical protein